MLDVTNLLELLHTSNDFNVQIKLFSTLSACLISNITNIDAIITQNSMYDRICYILLNCPVKKATVMFNFLSALVYTVDEDTSRRKALSVYAKNMIRSSGCLATLCELFTGCMMHQDAWRSLCQCLAETCRGIEANQSYCTHLIPVCIQRCSQRNIEVFLVLQSLLQNHARNINLFLEQNGIAIFKRPFLTHTNCLQLLCTLVQNSTQSVQLISSTDICENLRDFLCSYGPQSQLGQWATVIHYYIKGPEGFHENQRSFANKPDNKTINKSIPVNINLHGTTDTTGFLQNVMHEIIQCSPPNELRYLQEGTYNHKRNDLLVNRFTRNKMPSQQNVASQCNFSCLENNIVPNESRRNIDHSCLPSRNLTIKYAPPIKTLTNREKTFQHNDIKSTHNSSEVFESFFRENFSLRNSLDLSSFKPKFASTPLKYNSRRLNRSKMYIRNCRYNTITDTRDEQRMKRKQISSNSIRKFSHVEQNTTDKEIKHRSISGWLFETVNESCTAFVKTVKNIFKPKVTLKDEKKVHTISASNELSCSYSFTNYMKKRDAILTNECTKKIKYGGDDFSMNMSNPCNTCNDTLELKNKLANDEFLKQTVRKLKLGVNLYGCDFKKISKQLWPHQTYMTPTVLYNLYRKLIIK